MKSHTFNGRKHTIDIGRMDGWCDQYKKQFFIHICRDDTDSRAFMETCIHEALHACNWKASEESVTQTAYDLARFLWRLGYRHQESGK